MKLNKILGVTLLAGITILSATSVFAADSDKIAFGKVFDITDNKEASELVVGHKVAIPFDIQSTSNSITSASVYAKYDSDVLSAGIPNADFTADEKATVKNLAGTNAFATQIVNDMNDSTTRGIISLIGKKYDEDEEAYTYYSKDSINVNTAYAADTVMFNLATLKGTPVSEDVDGYFLFVVTGKPTSDALNQTLVELDTTKSVFTDINADKNLDTVPAETEAKANACAGAFTITLDDKELAAAHKFVQGLYVEIYGNKTNIYDYTRTGDETNGYTYTFPVRLKGTAGGDIAVDIYAEISETETGAASPVKISADGFTVTLNSPADYTAADVTVK